MPLIQLRNNNMKNILAEILTIGDEILLGQITDTNSQWISTALTEIGVRVVCRTSVGDTAEHIVAALKLAEQRADVVIMTGGLGPTKDDITKKTLAEYFGCDLVMHPQALADLEELLKGRGRLLNDLTRLQALQPTCAEYIKNPVGTAPAMWFSRNEKVFVSMPGVPFEMKEIMKTAILPKLKAAYELPTIIHKIVRTVAYAESTMAKHIATWEDALPPHIKLAYLPAVGAVKLRLTGTGASAEVLEKELNEQVTQLLPLLEHHAYASSDLELEEALGQMLKERKLTLAAAESCTGGMFGERITAVAGSSAYFLGSMVCYTEQLKSQILGISPETIAEHGVVSEEVVKQMAAQVRELTGADIGVACTGIAGPPSPTDTMPVGMIWIALANKNGVQTHVLQLTQQRDINRILTVMAMMNQIRLSL
jgi:nicotinamide-nucleotide amidase